MRLIDADALAVDVLRLTIVDPVVAAYADAVLHLIQQAPTIEAEPVRHGRWEDHMVRDWRCSECGKRVPKQVRFDGYCYNDKLAYCPHCGAKMDGGGE